MGHSEHRQFSVSSHNQLLFFFPLVVLANLVTTYVDTIRSGQAPCMENAVLALAEIENSAAIHDATMRYGELMDQKLKLPTETVQELLGIHAECEKEALQVFLARAFKDDQQRFQVELMVGCPLISSC